MYINQTLKSCLVDFLKNTSFRSEEFKDVRKMFVNAYPEFRSNCFYHKTYQIFRRLQKRGYIELDSSTFNYRYTSINKRSELVGNESCQHEIIIRCIPHQKYSYAKKYLKTFELQIVVFSK